MSIFIRDWINMFISFAKGLRAHLKQVPANNTNNLKKNRVMRKDIRNYKNVGVQYSYILDSVYSDIVDVDSLSDKEKVELVFETFNLEYNYEYNRRCIPNLQDRIAEYLKGLPTVLVVAFSDYNIVEIGKSWGYCKSDKQAAKFAYEWFGFIAYRLIKLARYYNINIK